MPIRIFGVNHRTAPIDIREKLAVGADRLGPALRTLAQRRGINEGLILSTCNRTELYCDLEHPAPDHPLDWLLKFNGMEAAALESHIYTFNEEYAVRHALRVACGLDSMVLGEPQILGQLKQAYQAAAGHGATGKILNKLFQHSFYVAKQVRTQTAIGENPVSVAYIAVKLAQQIHGELHNKTALLVGAGETITLVAHHLRRHGIGALIFANRTLHRSEKLAKRFSGRALSLDTLPAQLARADIIVSSTSSRLPLITAGAIRNAIVERRQDPMFIVDLAVPRDVEAASGEIPDVYLYSVDDLNHVVSENTKLRAAAAEQAEEMINIHAQSFMDWLQTQDYAKTIVAVRANAEHAKRELLDKARRRLAAGDDADAVLANLASSLTNRFLHTPTIKIREAAVDGQEEIVRIAKDLLDPAD